MKPISLWSLPLILLLGMGLCLAQGSYSDSDDPPGRVARLSYMEGGISLQPAGQEEWLDADVNRPITRGDRLWIDQDSRAELQIGSAAIRLSDQTGFSFLDLTDNVVQIQLAEGALSVHLRDLYENEIFEIDTPNLAFSLQRPGDYRVEVNEAGDSTIVSVRQGEGEVTGGGRAFSVRSSQRAAFLGTDQLNAFIDSTSEVDDFDRWCQERDQRASNSISLRYVSPGVIGYQDLDQYGDWRTVPEYGAVWFPRSVAVGWAPYRYGHWAWVAPWGWTWIDDAPWGFAPSHYGRWAYVGGSWGWCPGPRVTAGVIARPVYAPALVAWIGSPSVSVGVTVGGASFGVGWFPLAPREVYVPPYHVSRTYVTNVNVTNTVVNNVTILNVTDNPRPSADRYLNRTALTATSRTAFVNAQPVDRNFVRIDPAKAGRVQVTSNVGIAPQEISVVGAAPRAKVKPPVELKERAVVAKTAPPPAPVPFARLRPAIEANGGRPLARREAERLEPQRGQPPAPVKVEKPAASPVPVESVARPQSESPKPPEPRSGPHGHPTRPPGRENQGHPPAAAPQSTLESAPPQSAGPATGQPGNNPPPPEANPPDRPDRPGRGRQPYPPAHEPPPAVQPQGGTEEPPANQGGSPQEEKSPREVQLEQTHQQQEQKLLQQQEQQRQRLEQRHQQQQQSSQQPGETEQQRLEHQKLEQQQAQQRQQLKQRQQQERQRVQQEERKKGRGPKKDQPPNP